MKLYSPLVFASLLFGAAPHPGRAATPQTSYPVFGILGADPALPGRQIALQGRESFEPIQQYKIIYMHEAPALGAVRDAKIKYGFDTKVIVYMGGFTTNPGGATRIEQGYRRGGHDRCHGAGRDR